PSFDKANPNAFLTRVTPLVPDNLGTSGMQVSGSQILTPVNAWQRTVRFHDGVVANTDTIFTFTLTPFALPLTPVSLVPGRPQGFGIPEPDATERISESIRDFVLTGNLWSNQGDVLLFEPKTGERSDLIRFANVANGPGGALTANAYFASDVI